MSLMFRSTTPGTPASDATVAGDAVAPLQTLLIVEDDPLVHEALREFAQRDKWQVRSARGVQQALRELDSAQAAEESIDVVLCDVSLPDGDGLEVLKSVTQDRRGAAVIMMTGYGSVDSAVSALRSGAIDYLTKPLVDDELRESLARAMRQRALLRENRSLHQRLATGALGRVVGTDSRMLRVFEVVRAVAPSRTTVLMSGESGTGKSLIAHAIHDSSPRREKPYVELSCGSIPETLLESELFGHVKGAFTGAHADKIGRFLAASGGTLFLDEINSASPGMQLKLLRVLQERRFEPVGSTQTIEVDVRVILASNQPLEKLVASGEFRQDLYYRINVVKIELPPLRERAADIPSLAEHFLAVHAKELSRQIIGFTGTAMNALRRYPFPGNIRELSNIVERAAVLCKGQIIELDDLPPHVLSPGQHPLMSTPHIQSGASAAGGEALWLPSHPTTLEEALREPERRVLLAALAAHHWNRQRTAEVLGINRTTLYKKMKQLGIDRAASGTSDGETFGGRGPAHEPVHRNDVGPEDGQTDGQTDGQNGGHNDGHGRGEGSSYIAA